MEKGTENSRGRLIQGTPANKFDTTATFSEAYMSRYVHSGTFKGARAQFA
jgi:hypothetical protein